MIYVACPEKTATGGTELLCQFYFKLKEHTKDVKLFYYNYTDTGNPVPERFSKYGIDFVTEIGDIKTNSLVIPEVAYKILDKYINIKKCIWWLSVDFYLFEKGYSYTKIRTAIKFIIGRIDKGINFSNKDYVHFSQSYYAIDFLKKNGVENVEYLSDYIGDNFLKHKFEIKSNLRNDIVLYNPKKGLEFTAKIIKKAQNIQFIPLINLSQDQIIDLCKTSKVYIDFGNHPGKDRFPREAAHLGCVIVTGQKGSAKYYNDVKISDEFKFHDNYSNIKNIINKIDDVFKNYDQNIDKQADYRKMICYEEEKFETDVEYIYAKYLKTKND